MSEPAKNTAQPTNRYPSTFIYDLSAARSGLPAGRARWHAGSRRRRDRLMRGPARLDMRVVPVERGALGPDPPYRREVVPRRRAGRRPLQIAAPAPGVV